MKSNKRSIFLKLVISISFVILPNIGAQSNSPHFTFGLSERLRFVSWDNAITLNDEAEADNTFTRYRTSIWTNWKLSDYLEFYVKLTNEFRYYFTPDNKDFEIHEIIFDNLYLKYRPLPGIPLTLTLGRQNIMLGEGFVVMDGHPLDGSRSIYFNAVRGDIKLDQNDNLTFFYTYQPVTDDLLPLINDKNMRLIEKPETGLGIYYKALLDNSIGLDAYVINKKIESTQQDSIDENFNTFGFRISSPITKGLSITAEAAYQTGNYENHERNSYGGYAYLDYTSSMKFPLPQKLTLGLINLSGDDPSTKDMEGWDPLFSRWPKWSESYIYTQILENGGKVAYWSNFISIYGSVEFDICEKINLDIDFHHLMSHRKMLSASLLPGGEGKTRGELFIVKLNAEITDGLSGHLLLENFWPGNYYSADSDGYYWLRIELMYKL
ncbi:hypothetical protein ACFLR4_03775 [Bacteroidota bacterium]